MSGPSGGALHAVFTLVCALLVLKAQLLGAATAATRGRLKRFVNPEDASWLGGDHVDRDDAQVERLLRAHRNDLENLLPFFVGGTLYVLSVASTFAGLTYFGLFALARFAHSYAYLTHRARLRRDAYTAGWLVTIVMVIHATWSALITALA